MPRYRVPQHWGRQLGGTLGEQVDHLRMDLEAKLQALADKRCTPMVQRVVGVVRAEGDVVIPDVAARLGASVASARQYMEQAVSLGLLTRRMERVGCTRRNVYKVVAGNA